MEDLQFLHQSFESTLPKTVTNLKDQDDQLASQALSVIVVEDDTLLGKSIQRFLQKKLELEILYFTSGNRCLEALTDWDVKKPFCLITDISLEHGSDGLLLMDLLRERHFQFASIAMTGFASIETAIAATKKGVYHYLTKPFELSDLEGLVLEAAKRQLGINLEGKKSYGLPTKNTNPFSKTPRIQRPDPEDMFCSLIGRSKQMKQVFERIQKVADSDSTILISGASGTGKELVAKAIHQLSTRSHRHQISINCGAIPSELLESELFGHTKGAFTGAISNRIGRFEQANSGTIFLDEIGDMPLLLQVKLLRVLQSKQIEPIGGHGSRDIDVRVIAATHRDLERYVSEGKFREDLFYRLNVIPIKIPLLKDRKEDIPLLIGYFLDKFVSADKRNNIEFSDDVLDMLIGYDWPGNVRELENVIERLVILRGGNKILPEDLPAKIFRHNPLSSNDYQTLFELPEGGVDLKQVISDIEDSLIRQALGKTNGNKNQASKLLKLNRTTLIEKIKKKSLE